MSAVKQDSEAIVKEETVIEMLEVSFVCVPGNKRVAPDPPNALRAAVMVEQGDVLLPQEEVAVDETETYSPYTDRNFVSNPKQM